VQLIIFPLHIYLMWTTSSSASSNKKKLQKPSKIQKPNKTPKHVGFGFKKKQCLTLKFCLQHRNHNSENLTMQTSIWSDGNFDMSAYLFD